MDGFHRSGRMVAAAAERLCDGRLVLIQEGGYARTYAAYCLHATLEGVLGTERLLADPIGYLPDDAARGDADLAALRTALSPFWDLP
jgi:acetoin utilization deacetylase AcuC-like enzyme